MSSKLSLDLPKVYPITDTRLSGLSHAEQVERLIEGGATFIQLRDKTAAPRHFYDQAQAALVVARKHQVRLIINDRVDVALAIAADGVHLGQTDLPATAARRLLGSGAIIGLSSHNLAQAKMAVKQPIDYLAFGPIFATQTKTAANPTVGLDELRRVRDLVRLPLVAIGGITAANAPGVLAAGADAVATISEVVAAQPLIAENLRRMLTAVT
jgi:thiamine-phosphate pyrophosphorylase